jgi:unsaturated rhamnogalacturonyl hydrolase
VKLRYALPALLAALQLTAAAGLAQSSREKWISVADKLAATDPTKVAFNWGEGVQMSGLMQAWGRTKSDAWAGFVQRWADFHLTKSVDQLLGLQPGSKRRGYCGYWVCGTALLYLDEARPKPDYRRAADEMAGYIRAGATRSPEGLVAHWEGNFQLWVDTLNMVCPLLSRLAKLENKPEYLDDAVNQLLLTARHDLDAKTGLYYHMWDWKAGKTSPELWGRGNGWVIMSLADTFEFLPRSHPRYKDLKQMAERHARALVAAQNSKGAWHTVMNVPDSPEESSATCMNAYGMLKLIRLGVLPAKYRAPALKAWETVNARWVQDGKVIGTSGGTGPGAKDSYVKRPVGTFEWGTGSYLMAGTEVDRLSGKR